MFSMFTVIHRLLSRAACPSIGVALAIATGVIAVGAPSAASASVNPVPLISTQEIGMPSSGLDVSVALGNDGTLAFRAAGGGGGGAGGMWARTGSGVRLTLQGNNFGAGRSVSVNGEGVVGFVRPGGAPSVADDLISYDTRVAGGVLLTIRGSDFGVHRFVSAGKFSSWADGSTRAMAIARTAGDAGSPPVDMLVAAPLSGGSKITIVGDLRSVGINEPRDMDSDDDGYAAFRGTSLAGLGGIYARQASSSGGVMLTVTGQNFFPGTDFVHVGAPTVSGDTVAFAGRTGTGDQGVFAVNLSTGVIQFRPTNNPPVPVDSRVAINRSLGLVYEDFFADGTVSAIMATDLGGSPVQRVIGVGDVLGTNGATVSRLVFDPQGFSDVGDLAFYAELSDGSAGVFLASAVPAPGVAATLLMGATLLVPRRRRA